MRSLQDAVGRELLWKPRSLLSRTYDLVDTDTAEGEPYATLSWRAGLSLSPSPPARAECADGRWLFRHRGFLRGRVLVLLDGSETPLATFQRYWRRGMLRFEGGREFAWRRESFWSTTWLFEDPNGMPVLRFRRRFSFPRSTTRVELDSSAGRVSEAPLLACLGWYLLLLARRHAAAHGGG